MELSLMVTAFAWKALVVQSEVEAGSPSLGKTLVAVTGTAEDTIATHNTVDVEAEEEEAVGHRQVKEQGTGCQYPDYLQLAAGRI